jgi:hypothetical protein
MDHSVGAGKLPLYLSRPNVAPTILTQADSLIDGRTGGTWQLVPLERELGELSARAVWSYRHSCLVCSHTLMLVGCLYKAVQSSTKQYKPPLMWGGMPALSWAGSPAPTSK